MSADGMERIQRVFQAVAAAPLDQRDAALARECGSDVDLRGQIEVLLAASDDSAELPGIALDAGEVAPGDMSTAAPAMQQPAAKAPGRLFAGKYKLRERLGEGGMGAVFVADQIAPINRRVAIKVIRAGLDTKRMLARFEQERQALALMDHPNIAKVFDAGIDEAHRPYFAMELVKGLSLTKYCDDARLSLRQRIELFIPVCHAVQHAHQKGIIHRDLKPSNILVGLYDGRPVPKVIDFGVAKVIGPRLSEQSVYTEFGSLIGTLEYMSPEQAELNNLDIDTRSDVYALGVVLYELLTGTVPFARKELEKAGLAEMLRVIKEVEPPKPSTKISNSGTLPSIAANRHTEPKSLTALVRGELDWIVMRALEKDRARRYATASGFAADIERYLAGERVEAVPASRGYRARKFIHRYKKGIALTTAFASLLVAGTAVSAWQAVRAHGAEVSAIDERDKKDVALQSEEKQRIVAEKQREEAKTAKATAEAEAARATRAAKEAASVLEFFQTHFLNAARPAGQLSGQGKDVTIRKAISAAEPRIGSTFRDQPLVEASLRHMLGMTYTMLDDTKRAEKQLKRAFELRTKHLGADDRETLRSGSMYATALMNGNKVSQAEKLLKEIAERQRLALGDADRDRFATIVHLSTALLKLNHSQPAIELLEPAIDELEAQPKSEVECALLRYNLAFAYISQGNLSKARPMLEQVHSVQEEKLAEDHPDRMRTENALASLYINLHESAKAVRLLERILALNEKTLPRGHRQTLTTMSNLALAYDANQQPKQALEMHRKTLELSRKYLPQDDPSTLLSVNNYAQSLLIANQPELALPLLEETSAKLVKALPATHPKAIVCKVNIAHAHQLLNHHALARDTLKQAQETLASDPHADHRLALQIDSNLCVLYQNCNQTAEAEALAKKTLAAMELEFGVDDPVTLTCANNFGTAQLTAGRWFAAIPQLERARAGFAKIPTIDRRKLLTIMHNLARSYTAVGRMDDAIKLFDETCRERESLLGMDDVNTFATQIAFADALCKADRAAEAISRLEVIEKAAAHLDPRPLEVEEIEFHLGECYDSAKLFDKAEAMYRTALDKAKTLHGNEHAATIDAGAGLAGMWIERKNFAEAETLMRSEIGVDRKASDWAKARAKSLLGAALAGQGKYAEAEKLLLAGYQELEALRDKIEPVMRKEIIGQAAERVADCCTAQGKSKEAAEWRKRVESLNAR